MQERHSRLSAYTGRGGWVVCTRRLKGTVIAKFHFALSSAVGERRSPEPSSGSSLETTSTCLHRKHSVAEQRTTAARKPLAGHDFPNKSTTSNNGFPPFFVPSQHSQ